jgi:hypothetical protein
MQNAIFFEEALTDGKLPTIDSGYIFSLMSPDIDDVARKLDPFKLEMISYSGLKSAHQFEDGVKFQAQGRKMFCMIEPYAYTMNHIEPTYRPNNTTGFMPFRFKDCETFLTKNNKYRILIPDVLYDCFDSFTIALPKKGDISVIYLIFDKDIDGVVLPFIQDNIIKILKSTIRIQETDSKKIAQKYIETVQKYDVWEGKKSP